MRTKIVQREFVLLQLLQLLFCFRLIDLGLNLFDQREDISHSQDPLRNPVGIERLKRIVTLTYADKLYGLTDNLFDGECSTSARVTIHFRQDYTRYSYAAVKLLSGTHSILTSH